MKFLHCSAFSFGKAKKNTNYYNTQTPGPGRYDAIDLQTYKKKEPKWRLGKANKYINNHNSNPGPGRYEPILKQKQTSPKYSFASKSLIYNLNSHNKLKSRNNNGPGPGSYNIRNENDLCVPTYVFGKELKCNLYPKSITPGPKYDIINQSNNFGNYSPKISFTKDRKFNSSQYKRPNTPGPGLYHISKIFGKDAPKYSFPKQIKSTVIKPSTPGPGKYKIRKAVGSDAKSISMKTNTKYIYVNNNNPAPNAYYPKTILTSKQSPSYRIGSSKRNQYKTNNNPGPGTYFPYVSYSDFVYRPTWKYANSNEPVKLYNSVILLGDKKTLLDKSNRKFVLKSNINKNEIENTRYINKN